MSVNNFMIVFLGANLCTSALGLSNDKLSEYVHYPQLHGYLKLHTEPADWASARIHCQNEDAILASPWTTEFTSAVNKLQSSQDRLLPFIFSGALVTFPDEAYYKERLPDELIGVQRCGIFLASGTTGDFDCHIKLPFVCYSTNARLLASTLTSESKTTFSPIINFPTLKTTTTPVTRTDDKPICEGSGYEFYSQTGHCYKFHSVPKKWQDANNTCFVEGGRLVVINSAEEARVVVTLFGQVPASSLKAVVAKSDRDLASVGIYWNFDFWKTLDGETIKMAGYDSWRDGLPHNATFFPYGGVHRDGTYNNVSNKADLAFICEKVPV